MITECPKCHTSFRVTAQLLRQARGQVRCGGCKNTFDALENLSEEAPKVNPSSSQSVKIFEQHSRDLLKSLDRLAAGKDVRIEDTGVEWRVLDMDGDNDDDNEAEDSGQHGAARADRDTAVRNPFDEPGDDKQEMTGNESLQIDEDAWEGPGTEGLEVSETDDTAIEAIDFDEVPEPADDEAPTDNAAEKSFAENVDNDDPPQQVFDLQQEESGDEQSAAGSGDSGTDKNNSDDQLRFDDNTPLPDEYFRPVADTDMDDAADNSGETPAAASTPPEDPESLRVFIDTGTEADWKDLLTEVDDPAAAATSTKKAAPEHDASDGSAQSSAAAELDLADTGSAADGEETSDGSAEKDETAARFEHDDPVAANHLVAKSPIDDDAKAASPDDTPPELELEELPDAGAIKPSAARTSKTGADTATGAQESIPELTAESTDEEDVSSDANNDDDDTHAPAGRRAQERHDVSLDDFEDESLVESIVMEGETVTDLLEYAERASFDGIPPPEFDDDTGLHETMSRKKRGGLATLAGVIAILLLGAVLGGQYLHTHRDLLATKPWFQSTIAPIYAALDLPVVAAWDIRAWQFESTSGSTDGEDQHLTIYSRIANESTAALPYPLIHVSLTDRWDDVIGSRVLAPADYLAGNGNLERPVPSGTSFAAVITIETPAADATGFKLNVCYPLQGQRLRCAIEDFRQ